jgi:hypothetical protein
LTGDNIPALVGQFSNLRLEFSDGVQKQKFLPLINLQLSAEKYKKKSLLCRFENRATLKAASLVLIPHDFSNGKPTAFLLSFLRLFGI